MSKIIKALERRFKKRRSSVKDTDPSILDYDTKRNLLSVMRRDSAGRPSITDQSIDGKSLSSFSDTDASQELPAVVEWRLKVVDEKETEPQSMEEEVKRLQTLQSYFLLDSEGEEQFDIITRMAGQLFDVPICLISLVDLGRQWFLSRQGLDATETSRKYSFCAHVVQNKYNILVVPDATKDIRFRDNPLVTDGLKVRFYAGAALVSPEGYKLGSFCCISSVARPQGITEEEQKRLHDFACMAVNAMVARRNRLLKQEYEQKLNELSQTFLNSHRQLVKTQGNLDVVLKRNSWQMDSEDITDLSMIARNLSTESNIVAAAARNLLQDIEPAKSQDKDEQSGEAGLGFHDSFGNMLSEFDEIVNPSTDVTKLFDNVNAVVKNFPYEGSLTVEVHKSVPKMIPAEDLLLFRCTLNLLIHCMSNKNEDAVAGSVGQSGLLVRCLKKRELLVEALQYGKPVSLQEAKTMFRDETSPLAIVANIARTLGGRFGMYVGKLKLEKAPSSYKNATAQSIFWFRIPIEDQFDASARGSFQSSLVQHHASKDAVVTEGSATMKDPFQNALINKQGLCG